MSNNANAPVQREIHINEMTTQVDTTAGGGANISIEKLAEKVYQLMLRDIKLEQERRGNRHK